MIAQQAIDYPEMVFETLAYHIDVDWLREAYRLTNKHSASGVDGVSSDSYAANLEENLQDLHSRLKSGRYKAPPVARVWLDKADGGKRPIGKPTFEDKIVQRAVVMVLEAIYEQDFYEFSFAFRPGHSPHQALHQLREQCFEHNINWVIDADIVGFFDALPHDLLRDMLKQRVNDGGILKLIGKWLKAGVMEDEQISYAERGSPQGGVISPLLANLYLHHVLDDWFVKEVQPRLKGRTMIIRFADDFVIGFELEADAQRVMALLPKWFARFGLDLHPDKTRLIRFGRPDNDPSQPHPPETFDFLGFTHYWAKSQRGKWVIKRKTAGKRVRRTIKAIWQWVKENRHLPIKELQRMLALKLQGHYQYFGIRGNYHHLTLIYQAANEAWYYWLNRRSRLHNLVWEQFKKLSQRFPLPKPRIIHFI